MEGEGGQAWGQTVQSPRKPYRWVSLMPPPPFLSCVSPPSLHEPVQGKQWLSSSLGSEPKAGVRAEPPPAMDHY